MWKYLFLLILFLSFALTQGGSSWLHPAFEKRRPITINNILNPNTLTDYQVLVVLDTQSLISQGKMRSDCGDIRFTDSDGTTLLNYWLESGCNSPNTRIWVKVPSIPASSTKTIYVYYGNPSATSLSNGYNTFPAFNLSFDGPIGGRNSIGGYHTCALVSDGTARCWGYNYFGQLGDGTTIQSAIPIAVYGLLNATAIATGYLHTCALVSDGTVKCWGYNAFGQLGDGRAVEVVPTPVNVLGLKNAVAIAAGYLHTCALVSDGTVKCWGRNIDGQLGDGTTEDRYTPVNVSGLIDAIAIAGGYLHTCALISDGTVKCWGYTPTTVYGLTNAIDIAAGCYHTCALILDGTVKCWGLNYVGQLGDGTTIDRSIPVSVFGLMNVVDIVAGCLHTCALISDGTVKCWGWNFWGQLGDGTTIDRSIPVSVFGLTNVVAIAAGYLHTCALVSDGTIKCWGYNGSGQLGDGTTTHRNTPVTVLDYNLGGKYEVIGGTPSTLQRPPYFQTTYFVRNYVPPDPTTTTGAEESMVLLPPPVTGKVFYTHLVSEKDVCSRLRSGSLPLDLSYNLACGIANTLFASPHLIVAIIIFTMLIYVILAIFKVRR